MPTYVISHLRGGYTALQDQLEKVHFDKDQDTLWLTGNLCEHTPAADVLTTFHFIRSLGKQAVTVLGDQEMKLLAIAEGIAPKDLDETTKLHFKDILATPDSADYIKWLRQRPLFHHDAKLNFVMVHAGIPPEWSLSQASTFATEAEIALSFGNHRSLLENTTGISPRRWNAKLKGWKRLQFILAAFTRIKKCNAKGYMDFALPLSANTDEQDYLPWYQYTSPGTNIIFDHCGWKVDQHASHIYPLQENQLLKITDTFEMFRL